MGSPAAGEYGVQWGRRSSGEYCVICFIPNVFYLLFHVFFCSAVQICKPVHTHTHTPQVSIPVWRRFGSMGDIIVTGVSSTATEIPANHIAATEGVDFPVAPLSVTMGDGQTIGYINISLPDNVLTSPLKVFIFTLTAVSRADSTGSFSSPRLSSSNLIGQVTIVDDEGGAGVFRVSPNVATVEEGDVLLFNVMREGGSAGDVSVLVRTVDGAAIGGVDYASLNQQLEFSEGISQQQLMILIMDDIIPEQEEGFRVELVGGIGSLVDPVNVS